MRPIDADALYEDMLCEMCGTGDQSLALSVIRRAPTIAQQTNVKLDRSRFGCEWCGFAKRTLPQERRIAYCEKCGCPLTEESWMELERRINGGTAD